jgi:ubiquinone/menaquinone biosynthesis C-methylase UbiE
MARAARGTDPSLGQFHRLAKYYDAINDWKDYRAESARLERLARRYGRRDKTSWLDVACGTGRHLEFLRKRFTVAGVDGSSEMLRIARARLPGTRLILGDMRAFRLRDRFDVVTCLFSAIGHLETTHDVQTTFKNLARHLKPGGLVIVEPWISPATFRSGMIHVRTHHSPSVTIARLAFSARRGDRSIIRFHFLVGEPGHDIRYYVETDEGLLLDRRALIELMRGTGLRAHFLDHGLMPGRGLLLGVKTSDEDG